MNVNIQAVKFDADKKLIDFIEAKMTKLDRFIERSTSAEVILKLDKDHENGNKVATILIDLPGDNLLAESPSKTFEEVVDTALHALTRPLVNYKHSFHK